MSDIILAQKTKLENVQKTMIDVKAKVQENERILGEYQEMWEYLGNDWKTKLLEMHDMKQMEKSPERKAEAGKKKGVKFKK